MEERNPAFTEVQSFFNAEYAFIKKWITVNEPNWDEATADFHELDSKFKHKYFHERILSSFELIEKSYMERKRDNG